jgi:hypothetical protein
MTKFILARNDAHTVIAKEEESESDNSLCGKCRRNKGPPIAWTKNTRIIFFKQVVRQNANFLSVTIGTT